MLGVALGTVAGVMLAQDRFGLVGTGLLSVAGAIVVGASFYYVGIMMSMAVSFLVMFKRSLAIFLGFVGSVALAALLYVKLFST